MLLDETLHKHTFVYTVQRQFNARNLSKLLLLIYNNKISGVMLLFYTNIILNLVWKPMK